MIQKGDYVWVVKYSSIGINVYKNDGDARKNYLQYLKYYKTHKPDDNDRHSYVVWSEVDELSEDGMHYAIVDDYWDDDDIKKTFHIYYFKTKVY